MITLFNRRELLLTYSMKQQGEVRMLLAQNKIPYKITTRNTGDHNGSRAHSGTMGLNSDLLYEYRIYVHKNDYEQAIRLLDHK